MGVFLIFSVVVMVDWGYLFYLQVGKVKFLVCFYFSEAFSESVKEPSLNSAGDFTSHEVVKNAEKFIITSFKFIGTLRKRCSRFA